MMIKEQNDHRYLYFAAKCSCFLANFYTALIFWFFCIKAKEHTEKKRTHRKKEHKQQKRKKDKNKKYTPRPYKNGVKKNGETKRPQNLCRDM
jgi:hypothetical protein